MNYTQKKSSCKLNHSQNINKSLNLYNEHIHYSKKRLHSNGENESNETALLGNRELDKVNSKYSHIYKKFNRKHIAQYALAMGNITDKPLEKRRLKKTLSKSEFKLKEDRDKILKTINKSLCSCGRDPHFKNEDKIVDIKETEHTRRLKGLKSCGNSAACTVCAAKKSAVRGGQLKELMEIGRENGRSYMLVVTSIPHNPLEPLMINQDIIIEMSSYIFNSDEWKSFKKLTKCRFVAGGLENMVSFKNGLLDWHPHKNYLLDFDILLNEVIQILSLENELKLRMYVSQMMTSVGQRYLDRKGINKTLLLPKYELNMKTNKIDIKAGVSASVDFNDEYIAKWGLDAEMTASIYKKGRFDGSVDDDGNKKISFHPFGLLDLIDENNKDTNEEFKYQCIKAFEEFVYAAKGKQWFYFGRGKIEVEVDGEIKSKVIGQVKYYNEVYGCEINVKSDEEELLTLEDNGDLIYSLNYEEWLDFDPTPKKIGYALSRDTRQDILDYIWTEIESNRIKIAEEHNCKISTYISKKRLLE